MTKFFLYLVLPLSVIFVTSLKSQRLKTGNLNSWSISSILQVVHINRSRPFFNLHFFNWSRKVYARFQLPSLFSMAHNCRNRLLTVKDIDVKINRSIVSDKSIVHNAIFFSHMHIFPLLRLSKFFRFLVDYVQPYSLKHIYFFCALKHVG